MEEFGLPFGLYTAIDAVAKCAFGFMLIYYMATLLQFYNYSFIRVLTKHHKKQWHFYYFVLPLLAYLCLIEIYDGFLFYAFVLFIQTPMMFMWYRERDKKLVWTKRIQRLFLSMFILIASILFCLAMSRDIGGYSSYMLLKHIFNYLFVACFIFFPPFVNYSYDVYFYRNFARKAHSKMEGLTNLIVIAITGSYGKTSTKNFVYEILKPHFNVYATPRSVNTYKGIVDDILKNVDENIDIYVVEAGARAKGDIFEISHLVWQHYAIIGKIGNAHIEYFKDIETTRETKLELVQSVRLQKAFIQKDNELPKEGLSADIINELANNDALVRYPQNIRNIESNLDFTRFEMQIDSNWHEFKTQILGTFNIDNIAVAILMAREFGIDIESIKESVKNLKPINHRLFKITTPQKIILDDSFNGNFEGVSEAIRLASLHNGRKVIVTPGLVEYDEASNIEICKKIDSVFDLAIITGDLNAKLFDSNLHKVKKIFLEDKKNLESILSDTGQVGDLVLFANDVPNYI